MRTVNRSAGLQRLSDRLRASCDDWSFIGFALIRLSGTFFSHEWEKGNGPRDYLGTFFPCEDPPFGHLLLQAGEE